MTLSPLAVKQYLNRPFEDWRPYLKLSDRRMTALADRYAIKPAYWAKMKRHQRVMALIGLRAKRFCFWADTGTGKTLLTMVLARHFARSQGPCRFLVLVQSKVNKEEWQREIDKHMPDLPYLILEGTSKQKWNMLLYRDAGGQTGEPVLVIETYAGLVRMVSQLQRKPGRRKRRLAPVVVQLNALAAKFNGLVLDESQNVKHKRALIFRICRRISKQVTYAFALSGTPHGQDPSDLWSQFFLIDGGKTLGETLGLFRAAFFSERVNGFGGFEYTFRESAAPELNRILANRSIRIEANAADLPAVSDIRKYASLPTDAKTYYEQALSVLRARTSVQEMQNALVRMRQISSGFVGYRDEESGERAQFEFPDNPKLELLLSIVDSIDQQHKGIVFYDYTWGAMQIAKQLQARDIGYVHLWGGNPEPGQALRIFDREPAVRWLLLQNKYGAGLNLQIARYGLFWESPLSSIVRKQCRRRVERQESAHEHVFLYDLLVHGTFDERLLDATLAGIDLAKRIVDGKEVV